MNHSQATLRASSRIIPPDVLLKFGYTPNGAIKFDSAASLLTFSHSGTPKADVGAFGLALRDGEGLVVGHSAQIAIDGEVNQLSVFGTSSDDSSAHFGAWAASGVHPIIHGYKSRGATIGSNSIVQDNDGLLRIRALGDDGVDDDTRVAELLFEVDDASPAAGAIGGAAVVYTATTGGTITEALRIDSSQNVGLQATGKLFLDGMGDTYMYEESPDDLHIVVGGGIYVQIDQDLNAIAYGLSAAPSSAYAHNFGGTFTSGSPFSDASIIRVTGALTGAATDTSDLSIFKIDGSIATQTATENIGVVASMILREPSIIDNLTGDITVAATLYVQNAPTEGQADYAIYMPSGSFGVSDGDGSSGEQLTSGGAGGNVTWAAAASIRSSKQDIVERKNDDVALAILVATPVHDFKYINDPGRPNTGDFDTDYVGILADEAPWAMHHEGRILNPINTFGYTVQGFKALTRRVEELEAQLEATA